MVEKVAVITDSVACIPKAEAEKYGIEVIPVELHFKDKVYRDGVDLTPAEFYAMLRKAKELPTTAAALPGAFIEACQRVGRHTNHIFCITLSSKLSGMFNSARLAMETIKETQPDLVIELQDSKFATIAQGMIVLAAARAAALGKGLSEVAETARSVMQRMNVLIMVDTLSYLVKGGRVPRIAALAGSLLKIKPIITFSDGEAHPVTNARTTEGAKKRILDLMEKKVVKDLPLHVSVMHADALDKAKELRDQIAARFPCAELFISEFTPVMGAHAGPGVLGVAFYSGE
ncbi:MAG: DegV family protein [Chloroflexi bacterium]|nr:DegV family protein [Chloroflexota bacterium]